MFDEDEEYDRLKDEEAIRYFQSMESMFATQDLKFLVELHRQETQGRPEFPKSMFLESLGRYIQKKEKELQDRLYIACKNDTSHTQRLSL